MQLNIPKHPGEATLNFNRLSEIIGNLEGIFLIVMGLLIFNRFLIFKY